MGLLRAPTSAVRPTKPAGRLWASGFPIVKDELPAAPAGTASALMATSGATRAKATRRSTEPSLGRQTVSAPAPGALR